MQTITVDIINEKALNILKDLEVLQLIRLRENEEAPTQSVNWMKYKGAMSKQPIEDIELQINELRNSWEWNICVTHEIKIQDNNSPFLHTLIAPAQQIQSLVKAHFLEQVHVKAHLSSNGILLMEEMEKVV